MAPSLWEVLITKSPEHEPNVQKLVAWAVDVLELVRDTFPTYTLHNHVHSENVMRIMEDLLGDEVESLTGLEAAVLILSAYFHDIGMVYQPDEIADVAKTRSFELFLDTHPYDYLRMTASSGVPDDDVLESYCRWAHAERAATHLARLDQSWLMWGVTDLSRVLALVCESHDRPLSFLHDHPEFNNEFRGDCDLAFCALILRTADLLDFDTTRSPEAVYNLLGLARRETPRRSVSDVEWRKHLNSDGFTFPEQRARGYHIHFSAGPDAPAVEHDIREFLSSIESQLAQNQDFVRFCNSRWHHFQFPAHVDTTIVSRGYTFGDHKFSLDRESVLDLFMGGNLYRSTDLFLRELLQNAIDATRVRARIEGVDSMDPRYRLDVTDWWDSDGYQWVSVGDNGVGMSRQVFEEYLLRIGASYYESPAFSAEYVRNAAVSESVATIGRFGIGILSAFLVADRVNLTSRKITLDGQRPDAIRVQFDGMLEYFALQTESQQPVPALFPDQSGGRAGYRSYSAPGTTIAIRIDGKRHDKVVDVLRLADNYLMGAPVPVYVNGTRIATELLAPPKRPTRLKVSIGSNDYLGSRKFIEGRDLLASLIDIEAFPLDFGDVPGRPEITGSGWAVSVDIGGLRGWARKAPPSDLPGTDGIDTALLSPPVVEALRHIRGATVKASSASMDLEVEFGPERDPHGRKWPPASTAEDRKLIDSYPNLDLEFVVFLHELDGVDREWIRSLSRWSHNGVLLPAWRGLQEQIGLFRVDNDRLGLMFGNHFLRDQLRPDLNVARDSLVEIPFHLLSAINLSIRLAYQSSEACEPDSRLWVSEIEPDGLSRLSLRHHLTEEPTLGEVLGDPLMTRSDGWPDQPLFRTSITDRRVSANEIRSLFYSGHDEPVLVASPEDADPILPWVVDALVELHFRWELDRGGEYIVLLGPADPQDLDKRLYPYPARFFSPYDSPQRLVRASVPTQHNSSVDPLNRLHPFAQWLMTVGPELSRRAPAFSVTRLWSGLRRDIAKFDEEDPFRQPLEGTRERLARLNLLLKDGSLQYTDPLPDHAVEYRQVDLTRDPPPDYWDPDEDR